MCLGNALTRTELANYSMPKVSPDLIDPMLRLYKGLCTNTTTTATSVNVLIDLPSPGSAPACPELHLMLHLVPGNYEWEVELEPSRSPSTLILQIIHHLNISLGSNLTRGEILNAIQHLLASPCFQGCMEKSLVRCATFSGHPALLPCMSPSQATAHHSSQLVILNPP